MTARSCPIKTAALLFFLLLGISTAAMAQDQGKADSLKQVLAGNSLLPALSEMDIYAKIAAHSSNPEDILQYADKLLRLALEQGNKNYIIEAHQSKAVAYRLKGNLKMALKSLFNSANLAMEQEDYDKLVTSYIEIANTYTANKDYKNALIYNKKALQIIRMHGNKEKLPITLLNTGYSYYMINDMQAALSLYNEAEPIFESIGLKIGKAYTVGNRALVYWKQKNYNLAEHDLSQAIEMLRPLGDDFGITDFQNQLGRVYAEQGRIEQAIDHTQNALNMAKSLNLKEQVRDASLLLSELYDAKKEYQKAFSYQSLYIVYKDSIESKENTKQLADLRTEFEVSLKEKEITILEKRQLLNRIYIIIAIFLLVFALVLLLYFRQRLVNARLMAANEQKQHNEKISSLLNVQETKALQSMVQGQENERKRLARELHNHFGSLLATIKVNMNAIDEYAIPNYNTLITLVDQACSDIRNLSHSLNIGISDDFGLVPALKELTANLRQANGLEVEFTASMCRDEIGSGNEIIIYRIIQELISNVLKHAGATKLSILLTCFEEENLINIMVHDNGKGFDAEKEKKAGSGLGLKSLIEMIATQQGEISFDSNPASGTTVNIDLPIISMTLID